MADEQAALFLTRGGEDWTKFQKTNAALDFTDWHFKDFNLAQREFLKVANFDRATFELVEMSGSEFRKGATFRNAKFNRRVIITPKDSNEVLDFSEAEFFDDVHMKVPDCHHRMKFDRAKFHKGLSISYGPVHGGLDFSSAEFHGDVSVQAKTGPISFKDAKFGINSPATATFTAEFGGYANFDGACFLESVRNLVES